MLLELKDKLNMTIVFITHDLAVASQISDRIVVKQNGEVEENSHAKKFFTNPENSYSKTLLNSSLYLR